MKVKLIRWNAGDGDRILGYDNSWNADNKVEDDPVADLKELADFCDQQAESRNNHRFVGTHRLMAVFFKARLGEDVATALMREIAERGGIDGMSGQYWSDADGDTSSFADFGIKDCWGEW